jgi:hypothetical protein
MILVRAGQMTHLMESKMSSFWPDGLEISDTQAPIEILNTAQEEWQTNSNGILELVLQDAKSEFGNSMIIVHAKNVANNRTATLFSVVHQPGKPYPVAMELEEEELPSFLRKSYYETSPELLGNMGSMMAEMEKSGIPVVNKWVSDTPSEFRKKLSEAFNLGIIKREILNLVSSTAKNTN